MRPRQIEEGDEVLVYNSSLDNQHGSMWKLSRWWFGSSLVMSTNDNATYYLSQLEGTRIAVPVVGKWIKAFKKQHESEPNQEVENEDVGEDEGPDEDLIDDGLEEDK